MKINVEDRAGMGKCLPIMSPSFRAIIRADLPANAQEQLGAGITRELPGTIERTLGPLKNALKPPGREQDPLEDTDYYGTAMHKTCWKMI